MIKFTKGDLHMHTQNSDGLDTLEQLELKIYNSGINKVVSITDHHYMTTKKAYIKNDVLWIPGIEISAVANNQSVHITGYGVEPIFSDGLINIINGIINGYNTRALGIYNRLLDLGFSVPPFSEFRDSRLPPPIYKSDLVKQLGKIIGSTDQAEIRKRARENGNLLFIEEDNFMPDISVLVPEMHKSGMIACWAHPGKKLFRSVDELQESMETLDLICSAGIDGIEPYAHKHTPEQTDLLLHEAKKRGLLITGGSDYHGEDGQDILYPLSKDVIENFLLKVGYNFS